MALTVFALALLPTIAKRAGTGGVQFAAITDVTSSVPRSNPSSVPRFMDISTTPTSVWLSVEWPSEMFLAPPFFEFYMRTNLADMATLPLGWVEAEVGETNVCVEICQERMPGELLPSVAFFTFDAFDGLGGDGDDDDGDGLSNAEERNLGTNPRRSDTDGDGYDDGQEVAFVRYGTSFPAFDLSNVSNVFAGTLSYATYPAYTVVNLPFSVELAGCLSTNVVVHFAGIAEFLSLGAEMPAAQVYPYSPSLIYSTGNTAVSAYGYMFMTMGYSGSQLRAGVVTDAQVRWFVAEWRDMLDPVGLTNLTIDQAVFQLAVSEAEPDTVHVRYLYLDSGLDGTSAIIGAHGFDGIPDLLVANDVPGSVTNGMTISYHFGTGTNPICADTDGDGLPDGWEAAHGMDPLSANTGDPRTDASADPDLDGLTNVQEAALRTDPFQPDTDGDGMDDCWEVRYGFDPTTHNGNTSRTDDDADADPDGDGLANADECAWGTNPSGADMNGDDRPDGFDTDGDGVADGTEIEQNSDPADSSDGGQPGSRIPVPFYFGDHSTSHSEKYALTVVPIETSGNSALPRMFAWVNANYGECETRTAMLTPGHSYEIRLAHVSTNRSQGPDYDYTLQSSMNALPPFVQLSDPDSLFGVDNTSSSFSAQNKVAVISAYKFTVEEIKFNHDMDSCSTDAVTIRRNVNEVFDTSHGEWWAGGPSLKNDPVCYAGNVRPTVKAKIRVSPHLNSARLSARAIETSSPLGGLTESTVIFSNGVSDWIDFSTDSTIARTVRKFDHRWEWKVSQMNGATVTEFACTTTGPHRVYTLLADPKPPWIPNGTSTKNLWTNALEFCDAFLEGKEDPLETMATITSNLFYHMGFRYDTEKGVSHYWYKERVFDACIGPNLGTVTINEYLHSIIDVSTENERRVSRYQIGAGSQNPNPSRNYTLR